MHLETDGRLAEEDAPVGRDVEIVGEPQPGIVDDREQGAVGLVGELAELAVGRDLVEPHAADADVEIAVAVEGEPERLAADMGEDFVPRVVRARRTE